MSYSFNWDCTLPISNIEDIVSINIVPQTKAYDEGDYLSLRGQVLIDGYDLKTNLYLTPWEAALSTKVTINGINEDVSVYVPAGIQSGEKIEIENRGYKDGKGGRGKLILDTKIMIPKKPNEEELKLFKEFEKMSKFNPRNS